MREILFRGFHRDENGTEKAFVNGEWVKGTWVYGDLNRSRISEVDEFYITVDFFESDIYDVESYNVFEYTVGQYTGLKDKNGKKIFEGDIVDLLNCEYIPWVVDKTKLKVEWCNDPTGFYPFCSYGNYVDSEYVEVIGNIFENQELIENAP